MSIIIFAPNVGKLRYNIYSKRVSWIECWEDEKEQSKKRKELIIENRMDLYDNFIREINIYRKETGASIEHISNVSGISRQSLSKYLNKTRVPKVITIKHICKSLGIDI